MELEIKHLAQYLPYGLKAILSNEGKFNLDSEYPNEHQNKICTITDFTTYSKDLGGSMKVDGVANYSFDFDSLSEIQIVLHPLSEFGDSDDLRKVHEFIVIGKWCEAYDTYFDAWFNDACNIDKLVLQAPYEVFQYFLANHYDVFGLISNNLAIDINTLKQ